MVDKNFKVTFSLHQKYHLLRLAEGLEKRGFLYKVYSIYPKFKVSSYDIPKNKIHTSYLFGALRFLLSKWKMKNLDRKVVNAFDKKISKILPETDNNHIFHGLNISCEKSLVSAKKKGYITFLERACPHIDIQEKLINEEYKKLTGTDENLVDPRNKEKMKREYELADYIIVPSEYSRRSFIEKGFDNKKIIFVPLSYEKRTSPPKKRNLDEIKFLCIGGNFYRKGIYYLLKAWDQLDIPKAKLIIKGRIPDKFSHLLDGKNIENITNHLTGDELADLYRKSSVFILPSIDDGFGMVVAEAMTAGLPVIVTENVGIADGINDYEEGFVVPIRDPEALAEKIAYFYNNPEKIKEMGSKALEKSSFYHPSSYVERMINAYRQALK